MTEAALTLVDGRAQVRKALEDMECSVAYTVRGRYPRSTQDGVLVTVGEYTNTSTDCPVVDKLSYQIDLWAFDRGAVVILSEAVNRTLLEMGFLREYAGPDERSDEPAGYCRKTFRYGRKVDKRWMRLMD